MSRQEIKLKMSREFRRPGGLRPSGYRWPPKLSTSRSLDLSTSRPLTGTAPGYATRPSTAELAPGPWPPVSGTWNDGLGHHAADWPDTFLAKGWGRRPWALAHRINASNKTHFKP